MNIERLRVIQAWLEAGGDPTPTVNVQFDMMELGDNGEPDRETGEPICGTPGCIAGAANAIWGRLDYGSWMGAEEHLGLSCRMADELFQPDIHWPEEIEGSESFHDWPTELSAIDAAWAARTIAHLIATGEVRWDLTK